MEEWIKTATKEEQEKNYKRVVEVINDCNDLLNKIKAMELLITEEV